MSKAVAGGVRRAIFRPGHGTSGHSTTRSISSILIRLRTSCTAFSSFGYLGLLFPRMRLVWRLFLSVSIEASWEIVENSSYMIERYRQETISLDYFGDSIINSLSDITCFATGFVIAYKLRFWKSLAVFLATEAVLIVWIHDSLLINILMLIWPIEAIKKWQMAVSYRSPRAASTCDFELDGKSREPG